MWWNERHVNRRDWILEHMETLNLSTQQIVVLLLIDFYNSHQLPLDQELLEEKTGINTETMNKVIASLSQLEILKIEIIDSKLNFNIDGLFREKKNDIEVEHTLFEVFEIEFGRTLSQKELTTLNEWLLKYSEDEILEGLRKAIIYQKTSLNYIEAILVNSRNEL